MTYVAKLKTSAIWEVVLVDNGSSDHTKHVMDRFQKRAPCPVQILSEGRKGLGRARNTGSSMARGRVFVYTDDDCYPESDFIQQVQRVFEESEIGYMGGRILLYDEEDGEPI